MSGHGGRRARAPGAHSLVLDEPYAPSVKMILIGIALGMVISVLGNVVSIARKLKRRVPFL